MTSEGSTDRAPQCLSCDSAETERLDEGCRCLDCGAAYKVAPNGNAVYTVKGWWFVRIGVLAMLLVTSSSTVLSVVVGWPLFATVFYAVFTLAILAVNGNQIREAIEYGV